jgi:hypothetical protein
MHVFRLGKPFSGVGGGRSIPLRQAAQNTRKDTSMTRQNAPTCDDCYFRRHGLCAMAPERPCPTFRAAARTLQPPHQPRLVPLAVSHAAVA